MARRVLLVLWIGTAALIAPDVWRFAAEWRSVARLAAEIAGDAAAPAATAHRIAGAVAGRVRNVQVGAFYDARRRPLLRHTAWETWTHGEGQCGEATRVIVNMLQARGISASRLSLSNDATGFYHTAVAFSDGESWRLLDSIGAPPGFHEWSLRNRTPLHELVAYTPDIGGAPVHKINNPFFTRFSHFNWSRLAPTAIEINQRAAFPDWVIVLIENPPLVHAAAKAVAGLGLGVVWWAGARAWRWRRDRARPA